MDLESSLVKGSWISPNNFLRAKEEQKKSGRSLYSILVKTGYISEEGVFRFFSQNTGIPFVNIADYVDNEELVQLFPESLYREFVFFPLCKIENVLYCAMANPLDTSVLNTLRMHSACDIQPLFSTVTALRQKIDVFFGPEDKYFDVEELIIPPQTLQQVPFWRESERCVLNEAVEIKPDDERITLISRSYLPANATDISRSGKALGISAMVFLPPKSVVLLRFPDLAPDHTVKGEVVRCALAEKGQYLIGVCFVEIDKDIVKQLLDKASLPPSGYIN